MAAAARVLWAASHLRLSTLPARAAISRSFTSVVKDLRYSDSHEWVKVDGSFATIGVTDHAQEHLGDVVFVDLPEVGKTVSKGSFGAVESVKAKTDVNCPVSGTISEVNEELSGSPGLINGSPYNKGWIIKVGMSNASELNSLMTLSSTRSSVRIRKKMAKTEIACSVLLENDLLLSTLI